MELAGRRLGSFSLLVRRVFVGLALVPCLVAVANSYLGWGLFSKFGKWAIVISFVVLFLVMRYLGPTVQQLREYRASGGQAGR